MRKIVNIWQNTAAFEKHHSSILEDTKRSKTAAPPEMLFLLCCWVLWILVTFSGPFFFYYNVFCQRCFLFSFWCFVKFCLSYSLQKGVIFRNIFIRFYSFLYDVFVKCILTRTAFSEIHLFSFMFCFHLWVTLRSAFSITSVIGSDCRFLCRYCRKGEI